MQAKLLASRAQLQKSEINGHAIQEELDRVNDELYQYRMDKFHLEDKLMALQMSHHQLENLVRSGDNFKKRIYDAIGIDAPRSEEYMGDAAQVDAEQAIESKNGMASGVAKNGTFGFRRGNKLNKKILKSKMADPVVTRPGNEGDNASLRGMLRESRISSDADKWSMEKPLPDVVEGKSSNNLRARLHTLRTLHKKAPQIFSKEN